MYTTLKRGDPMSKHKRMHTFNDRNYAKFAGFVASRYGPPPKKKAPAGAANTDEGKAEHVDHAVSASHDIKD